MYEGPGAIGGGLAATGTLVGTGAGTFAITLAVMLVVLGALLMWRSRYLAHKRLATVAGGAGGAAGAP